MMMNLMRKHAKSWLIKFLVGIIALVFIFYFGYSFRRTGGASKVATVNGEVITAFDYQKTYRSMLEALQREYKSVWNENLVKLFDVKGRAMESLINQKLISQEAKRIGFNVTEKEVQDQIMSYPAFQTRGRFDEGRYRMLLQNNRMKPEDFEAGLERDLLQRKIEQFLGTFVTVTDPDVLDYYTYSNEKVKVGFVEFLPESFKKSVKVTDEGIEKFYQDNKERYRIPEKIKVAYVLFDPETFKANIQIKDKDAEDFYNENQPMFKEEREVRVRQILLNVPSGASEEQDAKVKEKALSILKKIRDGEDFAAAAKKYSEDSSKGNGGDLGYLKQGEMVKPVEEAVSKMKKGEVSEPIRSPLGYHILKLEDIKEARVVPFEEAKEKALTRLRNQAAADMAHDKALSFQDQLPYRGDLRKFASEQNLGVKESDYFSIEGPVSGVGGDQKLAESLFSLQQGDSSEVLDVGGRFYIFQVADRKPTSIPALTEVRDKVKEDLTEQLAGQEAKAAAEKYLQRLKTGEKWDVLAKETQKKTQSTDFFNRQSPAADFGYDQPLLESAFSLSEKKVYPDHAFETEKGVFVIRFEGTEGIDKAKFEEEKEKYRQSLLRARQRVVMENWLADLRKKADIKIQLPAEKEGPEL